MFGWLRREKAASERAAGQQTAGQQAAGQQAAGQRAGSERAGAHQAAAASARAGVPDPRDQAQTELLFAQAVSGDVATRMAARAALGRGPVVVERVASDLRLADPTRRVAAAQWLAGLDDPSAIAALSTALRVERVDGVRSALLDALETLGAPIADHIDLPRLLHAAHLTASRPLAPALIDFPWAEVPVLHLADADGVLDPDLVRHLVVLAVRSRSPQPDAQLRHLAGLVWRDDAAEFAVVVRRFWASTGNDPRRCGLDAVASAFEGRAQDVRSHGAGGAHDTVRTPTSVAAPLD